MIPLSRRDASSRPLKHKVYVEKVNSPTVFDGQASNIDSCIDSCVEDQMRNRRSVDSDLSEENGSICQRIKLLLVGFIVTGGGSFHFGYQLSIINPLADVLQTFIQRSLESHLDTKLQKWVLHLLWPTIAGLLFIGAFIGAILSSLIMQKWGLRRSFLISSTLILISVIMAFASKIFFSAELFILHRFINGLGVGIFTTVQTVYLAEISPVKYRGFMGTLTGFSTSIGFVVASAVGLEQCFGEVEYWHWSYAVEMIPTLILLAALPKFLPASPIRLLKKSDEKQALKSLTRFQNKADAMEQLSDFQREIQNETFSSEDNREKDCIGLLRNSKNALIICLLLNATVSFSGIISVSFFGTFLLQNIGFSSSGAALANCLASLAGILGNLIGSFTVDKIGRRFLIIGCLSVLALLNTAQMILVFIFQYTNDNRMGYAFLTIFMIFLFTFSLGVGPTAWFLATELSSVKHRARIQALSVSCQYITCFISSLVFLPLYHSVGSFSFLLFICPLTICAIYLYIYLPETKNRSIDDIIDDLQRRSLLGKVPPTPNLQ